MSCRLAHRLCCHLQQLHHSTTASDKKLVGVSGNEPLPHLLFVLACSAAQSALAISWHLHQSHLGERGRQDPRHSPSGRGRTAEKKRIEFGSEHRFSIDHFTWGLATAIYVAMVTPILYDNSYSLNDSNLKYESYRPCG